jgi:hypothetical protein
VPEGHATGLTRLVRAAGLRWPVEEDFQFSKGCLGLDHSQVRLYTAIARHTVLVMAALAVCAITAARMRDHTDSRALAPARPDQQPPSDMGMAPLTVPEIHRLIAAAAAERPPDDAWPWLTWRRRHQARSRWYHQRARLARDAEVIQVS